MKHLAEIRALIVDDEPVARRGIRILLREFPEIKIVGECSNGLEAVEKIRATAPDLVFLDIQMPELSGFDVVARVGAERMPAVIFVTAYEEFALRAFEIHALDYILKPIDGDRFRDALERAKEHVICGNASAFRQRFNAMLRYFEEQRQDDREGDYLTRFVVRESGRIFFLDAREVDWIEAAGNYVVLHVGDRSHFLRETMSNMEKKLNPRCFVRINRSRIVNIASIKELRPIPRGEYDFVLRDGTVQKSSRHYRSNVDELLSRS